MAGTTVTLLTEAEFAARMARSIPTGWASPQAKQAGGVLYGLLETMGAELSFAQSALAYALGSTRIQTATSPELDDASKDYLGGALPRLPGETDAAFSARIIAALFPTGATREAIIAALTALTGVTPRVIEPWRVTDTGAWDAGISYWDIDTQANPAIWTDTSRWYQGFIVTPAPPVSVTGAQPLQCFDRGNGANGAYWDVPGYGFFEIEAVPQDAVYAKLLATHVEGTLCWVKIQSPGAFH